MLLKVENVGTIVVAESPCLLFGVAQRNLIGMYNEYFYEKE